MLLEFVYTVRLLVGLLVAYFVPGHLILSSAGSRLRKIGGPDMVLLSVSLSVLVTTLTLFCSSVVSVPFGTAVSVLSILVLCLETWRCRALSLRRIRETSVTLLMAVNGYVRSRSHFEKILLTVVLYQLVISLMQTIYWPIFSWDALSFWLYYGRAFYEEGSMNLLNHQQWMNAQMPLTWGIAYPMVLPLLYAWLFTSVGKVDLLLANSVQVVFLLMLVLVLFQLFRRTDTGQVAFLACLFFLLSSNAIAIHWDWFKGVTDFPLLVLNLTLMYFALKVWRIPSATNALAAGIVAGLTAAIKQLGIVFALLAGALILLKTVSRKREKRINSGATHFFVYFATAVAFSAPYYIFSLTRAGSQTTTYWTPTVWPAFNAAVLLEFALVVLRGLYTRAWGLAPIIAFVAVIIAWRKVPLTKIVLYWTFGSLFIYYFFVSTTKLGSLVMETLSDKRYALPIFSLFAVIAGSALGVLWHKGQTERRIRRSAYSIVIVVLLVGNVALNFGAMQSYLLPPFMTEKGVIVDRTLDEKYITKMGGFYEVAMYINEKTHPDSVIITPGYFRYFFFNARDHRRLYGAGVKPRLWTSNLTELRVEFRELESPYVYVVEEPWYAGFAPYDFYFQSALYIHRQEIMTLVLKTADGYLLYQVKQEFITSNSTIHEHNQVMCEGGFGAF